VKEVERLDLRPSDTGTGIGLEKFTFGWFDLEANILKP